MPNPFDVLDDIAYSVQQMLDQDEVWIDAEGHRWRIEEMGKVHLYNVISYLARNASGLEMYYSYADFLWLDYWTSPDSIAHDDGERATAEAMLDRMRDPKEWLASTKLVSKLLHVYDTWEADGRFADLEGLVVDAP